MADQPLGDLIARLEGERRDADRVYNDALTAVDRATQLQAPTLRPDPTPYDATHLHAINLAWNILPEGGRAADRSLKGRLRGFVWRLVGPSIEAQQHFNRALVDHLNRNARPHEEAQQAIAGLGDALRQEFSALARFQSVLAQYLQTITPYVDTRDRSLGGPHLHEAIQLAQDRTLALEREVDRLRSHAPAGMSPTGDRAPRAPTPATTDAFKYVRFEDRFRGSREEIRARLADYAPLFSGASDVLDLGCGRGELLDVLRAHGVQARGVDVNPEMVERCRQMGLDAQVSDALAYVEAQPDRSLGGLVAIQVVEHFDPTYLMRLLETAYHKLRPQAPLLLETINPACWMAFFETYLRDLTHARALHPDTLRFLVVASGFTAVDVQYRSPVREADRLLRVTTPISDPAQEPGGVAAAVNQHADTLNARLFSFMDYAVIARR